MLAALVFGAEARANKLVQPVQVFQGLQLMWWGTGIRGGLLTESSPCALSLPGVERSQGEAVQCHALLFEDNC